MVAINKNILDGLNIVQDWGISSDLTFTSGAHTAVRDILSALNKVLDAQTEDEVEDIIESFHTLTDTYSDERVYTVYWLTGVYQVIQGPDKATAFNNAGIGRGALSVVAFVLDGTPDPDYQWDKDNSRWTKNA